MRCKFLPAVILIVMFVQKICLNVYGQEVPKNIIETFRYRSIGPTRQGGRTVDLAVPRQQPYTFYAATATGGMWKTVNNGQSFEPVFDYENVIALGSVAVAPSDPDIIYVAALGHFFPENSERGLYKTVDGGRSWTKSLSVSEDGRDIGVIDVVMNTEDPNTLYAATWDKQRRPWQYIQSGTGKQDIQDDRRGQNVEKTERRTPRREAWQDRSRPLPEQSENSLCSNSRMGNFPRTVR